MNSGILAALVLLVVAVYAVNACGNDYCDKSVKTIDASCGCPCRFLKCSANCRSKTFLKVRANCWKSCVRYCAYSSRCQGVLFAGPWCYLKSKGCRHCGRGRQRLINRGNGYFQYYTKIGHCRSREYRCRSQGGQCRSVKNCKGNVKLPGICPGRKVCCRPKPCRKVGGRCFFKKCGGHASKRNGLCQRNHRCCRCKKGYKFNKKNGKWRCIKKKKTPRNDKCTCTASGDPHYRVCDTPGTIHFQGVCWYTFSKTNIEKLANNKKKCAYKIDVRNEDLKNTGRVSFTTEVTLEIGGATFGMKFNDNKIKIGAQKHTIGSNGKTLNKGGVEIVITKTKKNGHRISVKKCDLFLQYERYFLKVDIGKTYYGEGVIDGICGQLYKRPKKGTAPRNLNSYKTDKTGFNKNQCKDYKKPLKCPKKYRNMLAAKGFCGIINYNNGPSKNCRSKNKGLVQMYFLNCLYDSCEYLVKGKCEKDCMDQICDSLNNLRIECKGKYNLHVHHWVKCASKCFNEKDGFCSATGCKPSSEFKSIPNNKNGGYGCEANENCCACKPKGGKARYRIWDSTEKAYKCQDSATSGACKRLGGFCVNRNGCDKEVPGRGVLKGKPKGKLDCPGNTECCVCDTNGTGLKWWAPSQNANDLRGGKCDLDGEGCKIDARVGKCVKKKANPCKSDQVVVDSLKLKCPHHLPVCCVQKATP